MGIDLQEIVPMTDEEGLALEGYTFIIENAGTIPASYTLTLDKETTSTLNEQYIKYSLDQSDYLKTSTDYYKGGFYSNKEKYNYENYSMEGPKKLDALSNNELDQTTLLPGEKMEYTLKLWLDYDAENEAMNKEYEAKIRVDGVQATTVAKGKAGDNVDYTLYKDGTLAITGTGEMNNMVMSNLSEGESYQAKYNGFIFYDIIYQKLEELGMANVEKMKIEGEGSIDESFSMKVGAQALLSTTLEYTVEDVINGGVSDSILSQFMMLMVTTSKGIDIDNPPSDITEEELYEMLFETADLLKAVEAKLPKVKRVVIDEGVTSISDYQFNEFLGDHMITLPSTIVKLGIASLDSYEGYTVIIPPKVTVIPNSFLRRAYVEEITVPNTVQKVEEYGLSIVQANRYIDNSIYIDNTKEFVDTNWDKNWYYLSGAKVIYLR